MWPFKKKKVKLPNNYVNLRCVMCGSSMYTDLEHVQVYCPNCGAELYVRAGEFKDLVEKVNEH